MGSPCTQYKLYNSTKFDEFLVAIEKIFVPEKLPEISERRRFGGITYDGVYLLSDEIEVNKVYSHFALFNKNKQLLNEQMRLEEILN